MPLTFDLPLEDLKLYQGISPKPAGFERYWADALAELDTLDPRIELVPAGFETDFAECFFLYFTGVGGARIEAKYVRPKGVAGRHPAVVQFHGYAGSIGDWADGPMLGLAAQGMSCFGLNCRGQGGRSEDTGPTIGTTLRGHIVRGLSDALAGHPERLLFRSIFIDTVQIVRIAMGMPEVDGDRIGVWGESQGGALTVACAALEPRVRRAAPVFPFLSDYKRVWEMDQAKDAYWELQDWFRRHDPLHAREDDVFNALGHIDIQHLADRIEARVLWRTGLMDTICPPSTQFAAYNKIRAEKEMVLYPDFGHEKLPQSYDQLFAFMREL